MASSEGVPNLESESSELVDEKRIPTFFFLVNWPFAKKQNWKNTSIGLDCRACCTAGYTPRRRGLNVLTSGDRRSLSTLAVSSGVSHGDAESNFQVNSAPMLLRFLRI
jgi:hypothetical protein